MILSTVMCFDASPRHRYAACKDIVIQRDFALALQAKTACTAPCFQLRAGKIKTIREWFLTCNVEMLARLLAPAGNGV